MLDYSIDFNFIKYTIKNKKIHLNFSIDIIYIEDVKLTDKQIEKEVIKYFVNDIKYLEIFRLTKKEVELEFNIDKWYKDNISSGILDTPDKFEKKLKVNKLPITIVQNVEPYFINNYMDGSFRNYLNNNPKLKKLICSSIKTAVKELSLSYFKINFDGYSSCFNVSLKPEFRINPMLFVKPIQHTHYKIDFDQAVKNKLNRRK